MPSREKLPKKINKEPVLIDASGKVLGRISTEIAIILRGKNEPQFRPYIYRENKVLVKNAAKIVLTGKKLEQKNYYHHTGYLGHLKTVNAKSLMLKNPSLILRKAVYGMLPKNKLRARWMKNLNIEN